MGDTDWKRIGAGIATGGASELTGAATAANGSLPGGGGKKSAPAPPDFAALAAQQTAANRPDQTSPFGSTTWDPTHQKQTTAFSAGLQPTADSMEQQATNAWSTPLDNGAQARQHAEDAIYGRETSRLDPMWKQREQDTNASLANQGLDPGSEAGGKQLDIMNRGRNDAYSSALQQAIMGGGAEASRQQQMDLTSRAAPLQGLAGLKSLLQMPGYGQAGDILGAGKMGYDANLQNFEANGGPLGGWSSLLTALGPLIKAGGAYAAAG
jgi:hypothetical protein